MSKSHTAAATFEDRMCDPQLPTRTVPINTAAGLVARHAALNQQLADALANEPPARPQRAGTMATNMSPEVLALTEQVEALEAQMEDSWVDFVLVGKPYNVWRDFKIAHPPKVVGALEQRFEVDAGDVVNDFLRDCITSPEISDKAWAGMLAGGIWPADLDMLAAHVIGMHEVGMSVPKSRLVSAVRATFDGASEQLADSGSLTAGSTAGSRKRSTATTRLTGS